MKLLFLLSEFSGLEMIISKGIWKPMGVPTIYRIIERTNKKNNLKIIITSKKKLGDLVIKGFKNKITFIKKSGFFKPLVYFSNILKIYILLKKEKIDIVYVDRANLAYAGILARFFKVKVILRLMGIYPDMLEIKKRNNVSSYLQRFFYLSPFSYVICTEDGSPGQWWLKNHLQKKVRNKLLLGGYDHFQVRKIKKISFNGTLNILFVSRLEKWKGCLEFLDAAIKILKNDKKNFFFTIVGKGNLENYIIQKIKSNNVEKNISIIKNIDNKKIFKLYNHSHVYVSLNKLGNLSNSNIEALSFGKCCIFLKSDPSRKVDISTDKIIPNDCVLRVSRKKTADDLVKKLNVLQRNPKNISTYEKKISSFFKKKFLTWDERLDIEEKIINAVFKGE